MPTIEFDKETIGGILRSRKGLHVPINQRSYQWKKEHVEDLYKDLNGAIIQSAEEYFLGTIVVVVKPGNDIEVYDGQQRLATSMILIAAIRDYFFKSGDTGTARIISEQSLYSPDRRTLLPETHFGLSADDNQFFINRILRSPDDPIRISASPNPKKESHERIMDAADAAEKHVEDITRNLQTPDKAAHLHKWLDFIEKSARVIWVQVGDQKTAFRIFETMNDRGLKLSAADLLKNYLYSLAEKNQADVVQKWQGMATILESLGPDNGDIVDYIRYFWITGHGHTRSNVLFDEIKREVSNEAHAISWTEKLEMRAHDYAALYTSSHDAWNGYHPEVRARVETLRFLGVTQVRPILLAAFGKFTDKEMEKLLAAAVNWSVRVLLTGVPSGTLEGHYSKNAKRVTDGAIKTVDDLAREMAVVIPDDERFRAAAASATVPNAQLARYYLRVLQMQADGAMDLQYVPNDGKPVTLEHILPVKPGPEWIYISTEDAKSNYNRLGNQALLSGSVNSKLGNVGYATKRPALLVSQFSLTKEAAAPSDWSLHEIAVRQKRMAELAVLAWPIR
jgi:hypothetical protein